MTTNISVALLLVAVSQAHGEPVCNRSPVVQDAIEAELGKKCRDISVVNLERIKSLNINCSRLPEPAKCDLKASDLEGLSNLQEIELYNVGGHRLRAIPEGFFQNARSLESISLRLPEAVESLSPHLLKGLKKLKWVGIYEATLATLPEDLFADNKKLEEIRFHVVKINELPSGIFRGLRNLQKLSFEHSKVTIRAPLLSGLSSLRKLDVESTKVELNKELLQGLSQLEEIKFQDAGIKSVPIGTFKSQSSVKRLKMAFNEVESIEPGAFDGLEKTDYLYLDENKIKVLKSGVFSPMKSLETLFIRGNRIDSIETQAFVGLEKLERIGLNGNKIKEVDSRVFSKLPSLWLVNVTENQLDSKVQSDLKSTLGEKIILK